MSVLFELLNLFEKNAQAQREKGFYFERLCQRYFQTEPYYQDLYQHVWLFVDWAKQQGVDARDAGIDLVAQTKTGQYHAIQAKFYAADYSLQKADIDSFFTASGKKIFSHRIIIATTNHWSVHAEQALADQNPPVTKIDLQALQDSVIDWSKFQFDETLIATKPKKQLREHQKSAVERVCESFKTAERGKLIMACGTGKTFTSLKIAERLAGKGKRVLFLVPSLSLLSQTLTEWTQESTTPLHSFAVCSDSDVGKKQNPSHNTDGVVTLLHELRYPATTDAKSLGRELQQKHDEAHMTVVLSTYHSIDVISQAQQQYGLGNFDLIICDEAHRTTGATFAGEDESAFVKVHDASFIKANKRLYMTATPRIYGELAKDKADKGEVSLCSMDDEKLFGKELFVINFSEAVARGLLVDYKVLVLAVSEDHISQRLQQHFKDQNGALRTDDAAKIIGAWKALSKQDTQEHLSDDTDPMRRAVAFCQVINPPAKGSKSSTTHKVSSTHIATMFQGVVQAYQDSERALLAQQGLDLAVAATLNCEAQHVDGGMNASEKEAKLNWLKGQAAPNTCRILSNVRCLSEGVDVPALDAVLFLTPRNSQVDVVQSVGRVMRNAPGKKRGYVVLPVVIPAGVEPHEALNDNKTYAVVWQVLQALRSHDDRFDAMINQMDLELGKNVLSKMEVVTITGDKRFDRKTAKNNDKKNLTAQQAGKTSSIGEAINQTAINPQREMQYEVGDLERAIYAKVVQKCGNRLHWEEWANDIAKIANTHISRITAILNNPANTQEISVFQQFAKELRDDLNQAITDADIVEMLAQHLITKPVFDALFKEYPFTQHNPMSQAMQNVLAVLQQHHLEKETETLQRFYDSVRMRAEGIESAQGKQRIVVELYDKFFRNAFPKMSERLGIVYTPVEVVDFIIHSVNHLLQQEFGQTLGDKNVHIIDPFTGTGTFITRLLQSGLITPEQMPYKYKHEIHANELVLLAYYIAAINIESVYHSVMANNQKSNTYTPFEGICLTDTFQMYEKEDLVDKMLEANSKRRKRQKNLDIRVIIGNPPYSAGQESANDNNANVSYEQLDEKIRKTYAARSKATSTKNLMDSYIRAIRWASDRVEKTGAGVIGFVSNAGFIDANTADGLRQCLIQEFSSLYVFHLRGNQRTSGELSRKEGGKIFGSGSRAPIAISLLVKNPKAAEHGRIYFYDIGDYLTREQKLEKITQLNSIAGIAAQNAWQVITPDAHGDWLNQRIEGFNQYISMGDKKDKCSVVLFENYSLGVNTNRDSWSFNFCSKKLTLNMQKMIEIYNAEIERCFEADWLIHEPTHDETKIKWSSSLKDDFLRQKKAFFSEKKLTRALYRPFTKEHFYFDDMMVHRLGQMPRIFPHAQAENRVIVLVGLGTPKSFSVIMSDRLPDIQLQANGQCFPLYLYDEPKKQENTQDDWVNEAGTTTSEEHTRRDAITDAGLSHFTGFYQTEKISKEDVFYYVYGLLHHPDYRTHFANNLSKELPRIPRVKTFADFSRFSQAGRDLASLHVDYEAVLMYPVSFDLGKKAQLDDLEASDFYVRKMKFAKGKNGEKNDKTTIVYNEKITLLGVPIEAYDYVVNGKAAIEWVMERQGVSTDKDSGITNDANDWAIETMNNPRYPLELLLRVITVSLETMKIVKALPSLDM